MLSLRVIKYPDYYTHLSKHGVEYYFDKDQPISFWYGTLAEEFGLVGKTPTKQDMVKVRDSLNTKSRNKKIVRYGVDLTFSAPKSVSIAYAFTQDKVILRAHLKAVVKTLGIVQKQYAFTLQAKKKKQGPCGRDSSCLLYSLYKQRP